MPEQFGNFSVYNYDDVKPVRFSVRPNHLLVGNGFSSSLCQNIFSYSALKNNLNSSSFSIGSKINNIFSHIGSNDFEEAIKRLLAAEPISEEYGLTSGAMSSDSEILKQELIAAIGASHPAHPWDGITDTNYEKCGDFLRRFKSVFTLNYDLLLYWTINRAKLLSKFQDGFSRVPPKTGPLVWSGEGQNLFHLHGGLHLYKILWNSENTMDLEDISEYDYIKIENTRKNDYLVDQIQEKLNKKFYPVTIAEGDSHTKKKKILNEKILRHAYYHFKSLEGTLYTFGVGLDKNQDDHLIEAIELSSLSKVCLGVYKPDHATLNAINAKFEQVNYQRNQNSLPTITVQFYDTSTFSIWQ
ncbi:DUF4917 family protein [Pseudobdellovibrio sp. HCB154]|uniref:DUF4917 family protein n=1 Tax=Pseudobdellovibrio sp. HCB154 TaxID=3386277 RepID=UPI0039171817